MSRNLVPVMAHGLDSPCHMMTATESTSEFHREHVIELKWGITCNIVQRPKPFVFLLICEAYWKTSVSHVFILQRTKEREREDVALKPLWLWNKGLLWGQQQSPRSAALGWISTRAELSWAAQFGPTTAPGRADKLPMSHLFTFLLCISTVQQVYTGK